MKGVYMIKPKPPGDIGESSEADLQALRDRYMKSFLEKMQEYSLEQRKMTRIEHEIHRLEDIIRNIDTLSQKRNITLRQQLEN